MTSNLLSYCDLSAKFTPTRRQWVNSWRLGEYCFRIVSITGRWKDWRRRSKETNRANRYRRSWKTIWKRCVLMRAKNSETIFWIRKRRWRELPSTFQHYRHSSLQRTNKIHKSIDYGNNKSSKGCTKSRNTKYVSFKRRANSRRSNKNNLNPVLSSQLFIMIALGQQVPTSAVTQSTDIVRQSTVWRLARKNPEYRRKRNSSNLREKTIRGSDKWSQTLPNSYKEKKKRTQYYSS